MSKSLKDKAIQIKGKDYVQVKDRLIYLSEQNEVPYSVETDYEYFPDQRMWVVKATLTLGDQSYTGLAQEVESDDYRQVNATSALENCETSAVGRACAMAGIGVIDSIASVDEINKAGNRTKTETKPATSAQIKAINEVAERLEGKDTELDTWISENLSDLTKLSTKNAGAILAKLLDTEKKLKKKSVEDIKDHILTDEEEAQILGDQPIDVSGLPY